MERKIQKITEGSVIVAALATIPVVVLEERGATDLFLLVADWAIWALFALDLGVDLVYSDRRVRHLRTHLIDVAVVVLSFPVFPAILALTRLIRLTRVFRILRLVMRYGALNQDGDVLSRNGDFRPVELLFGGKLPDPAMLRGRYSDEQLYALALYIYSLTPPPNPNKFDAPAARGQDVFKREGCTGCHTPPLYTNNKLTIAAGFKPPEDHFAKYDIVNVSVGTDPNLALITRRGTGYYKVPSLKGVWYRGPFEHNGSVMTLEDWFDPRRLREDYVPTGFKGYGVKTRAVKGHEFGLKLSAEDKRALIAFLKTL